MKELFVEDELEVDRLFAAASRRTTMTARPFNPRRACAARVTVVARLSVSSLKVQRNFRAPDRENKAPGPSVSKLAYASQRNMQGRGRG